MKRSKFTDEQILAIVKEGEAGRKVADVCRAHGITDQTYYRWKAKYGGMELSELQRLKQVEDENRRLYARHVDGLALRDVRFTGGAGDERPPVVTDDVVFASPAALYLMTDLQQLEGEALFRSVAGKAQAALTPVLNYYWPLDLAAAALSVAVPVLCLARGWCRMPFQAAGALMSSPSF